jgi:hypothetical protein
VETEWWIYEQPVEQSYECSRQPEERLRVKWRRKEYQEIVDRAVQAVGLMYSPLTKVNCRIGVGELWSAHVTRFHSINRSGARFVFSPVQPVPTDGPGAARRVQG